MNEHLHLTGKLGRPRVCLSLLCMFVGCWQKSPHHDRNVFAFPLASKNFEHLRQNALPNKTFRTLYYRLHIEVIERKEWIAVKKLRASDEWNSNENTNENSFACHSLRLAEFIDAYFFCALLLITFALKIAAVSAAVENTKNTKKYSWKCSSENLWTRIRMKTKVMETTWNS